MVNASGKYAVQIGDGSCLSPASDTVYVSVVAAPAKPIITVTGNPTICGSGSVDLSGPAGFEYTWSNGATTQNITVSTSGVYYLMVKTSGDNCPSLPSDPVVVTVLTPPCGGGGTNQAPNISTNPFGTQIEGQLAVDLTQVVDDPDGNIDFSTLRVINNETARGVAAIVDASYFLQIDYSGNPFSGVDRVTLEVCDLALACVQQVVDIDVVGEVKIYNGLTPDGDGYNDFMVIKYVDVVEGASENKVTIFNRWGDAVWDISNYNNTDRVFIGESNDGKELPSGTYFYKIELSNGKTYRGTSH
ncbi:MAG: gliding motility-associated C-terminal domain-containing protein [Cyclobacteriaceae bacterium]|nr:MAG: gliding motility-associated C-terminal domain-containing protein [Cyclobacteriaceae bacterium]